MDQVINNLLILVCSDRYSVPSITLESEFCISALKEALSSGKPEIFNTDQGKIGRAHV